MITLTADGKSATSITSTDYFIAAVAIGTHEELCIFFHFAIEGYSTDFWPFFDFNATTLRLRGPKHGCLVGAGFVYH